MSLSYDHGDIVFSCDSCPEVLPTGTSNFDSARNALKRAHWKAEKNRGTDEWMHRCPECQRNLI
jgi:hypothetical protein